MLVLALVLVVLVMPLVVVVVVLAVVGGAGGGGGGVDWIGVHRVGLVGALVGIQSRTWLAVSQTSHYRTRSFPKTSSRAVTLAACNFVRFSDAKITNLLTFSSLSTIT